MYILQYICISCIVILIRSPVNQLVCAGETVNFTCVVMFTSGPLGAASWFTNNANNDASRETSHTVTDDSNERSAPANVTTVLTVTNVSISDNGADYTCGQGLNVISDTTFLTIFGKLHYTTYIKTHDSKLRGQEEAGRTERTSELFTRSTALKFVNALNKPP